MDNYSHTMPPPMHAPQSVPPGSYPHWHGSNSLSAAPLLTTKYETSPTQTLKSRDIGLELEQQPVQAQQMTEGREKGRKTVDPPPVIVLRVSPSADPAQHFMQSPYLFMCAQLYKHDVDEPPGVNAGTAMFGSLCSSLHRLKNQRNQDTAFFVFPDISVKIKGRFRLHFSLFDLHKATNEAQYLGSVVSQPFEVLPPQKFKGMMESTIITRSFADQGVRLRLRKEPRGGSGSKRGYACIEDQQADQHSNYQQWDDSSPERNPHKRQRTDSGETNNASYAANLDISAATTAPTYSFPPLNSAYATTRGQPASLGRLPSNHTMIPRTQQQQQQQSQLAFPPQQLHLGLSAQQLPNQSLATAAPLNRHSAQLPAVCLCSPPQVPSGYQCFVCLYQRV